MSRPRIVYNQTSFYFPLSIAQYLLLLVFPDNLHCRLRNDEDDENYRKLATIIEDRELGGWPTAFTWLAAYTYDNPKNFDKYFLEQFEPISLDSKEAVVESAVDKDAQKVFYPVPVKVYCTPKGF